MAVHVISRRRSPQFSRFRSEADIQRDANTESDLQSHYRLSLVSRIGVLAGAARAHPGARQPNGWRGYRVAEYLIANRAINQEMIYHFLEGA